MSFEHRFLYIPREELGNPTSRMMCEVTSLGQAGWALAAIVPDLRNERGYLLAFQRALPGSHGNGTLALERISALN